MPEAAAAVGETKTEAKPTNAPTGKSVLNLASIVPVGAWLVGSAGTAGVFITGLYWLMADGIWGKIVNPELAKYHLYELVPSAEKNEIQRKPDKEQSDARRVAFSDYLRKLDRAAEDHRKAIDDLRKEMSGLDKKVAEQIENRLKPLGEQVGTLPALSTTTEKIKQFLQAPGDEIDAVYTLSFEPNAKLIRDNLQSPSAMMMFYATPNQRVTLSLIFDDQGPQKDLPPGLTTPDKALPVPTTLPAGFVAAGAPVAQPAPHSATPVPLVININNKDFTNDLNRKFTQNFIDKDIKSYLAFDQSGETNKIRFQILTLKLAPVTLTDEQVQNTRARIVLIVRKDPEHIKKYWQGKKD